MKMTVSVNNESGLPYLQYGTDKQKAKAAKFANANNKELTNLAYNITDRKHSDNKFGKNVAKAVIAVPIVGAAVVAAASKGKVSARTLAGGKSFIKTAGAMGITLGVLNANNEIAAKRPKVRKAENKHPILTLAGLSAIATGVVAGAATMANKFSPAISEKLVKLGKKVKLDKVAAKMDAVPEAIKGLATKVSEKIALPKGVKENLSKISSKIKMPQFLKDGYANIAKLETTQTAAKAMKSAGKAMMKNPVTTAFALIGTAIVAHAAKKSIEVSHTKAKLKDAQLKTANNLVTAYAAENESLKMANAKAADSLEKANNAIAEDKSEDTAKVDEE